MKMILATLVILALFTTAGLTATSALASEKVTICHATGSESNPFVEVEVSVKSIESGHNPHAVHVGDYIGACNGQDTKPTPTPTPTCWIPEGCPAGDIEYDMTEIRPTGIIEHGMTEVRPTATSISKPPGDGPMEGKTGTSVPLAFPNSGGRP